MKNQIIAISIILLGISACVGNKVKQTPIEITNVEPVVEVIAPVMEDENDDGRISLQLNAMQKEHQLVHMRAHLVAVQTLVSLLAQDKYEEASVIAYEELGSTTEMKMMCASFGNEQFENLGVSFHKSADEMSEIFKSKDKTKSLQALSHTMSYCISCHATYKQ